jgi:molybdopterin converting factor small subunit
MKILIPTPLRAFTGKKPVVEVSVQTVGEALDRLVQENPELRRHLYSEDGKLRSFVNVYLNEDDIRYLDKERTAVKPTDTLSIVPSVAGGVL